MAKNKLGRKIIAGLVATTIVAGAGVAGGMAIQNAYGDPNAGENVDKIKTELSTEKNNHEATKAELAQVRAELQAEKDKDVQDEAKIAQLETRVVELENLLARSEDKLYLDEYLATVSGATIVDIDTGVHAVYTKGTDGIYIIENDFSLTQISEHGKNIDKISVGENHTLLYSTTTGAPVLCYTKATKQVTKILDNILVSNIDMLANNEALIFSGFESIIYHYDLANVQELEQYAVSDASNLKVVNLYDGVKYLGGMTNCHYILDSTNKVIKEIEGVNANTTGIFYMCNGVDFENKNIYFWADDYNTGTKVGYVYNYIDETGESLNAKDIMLYVFDETGNLVTSMGTVAVIGQRVESIFTQNEYLGVESPSSFSKMEISNNENTNLVTPETVIAEDTEIIYLYW